MNRGGKALANRTIAQTRCGPIEYRRHGHGPVVLILGGGHCSRDTRLSHDQLADEGVTVIVPSRPGYDRTPTLVGRTAEAAADAMAALLDTLRIERVAVIGISAAGPTALALAQRHPRRIAALILESAVTTSWAEETMRRARRVFGRLGPVTWGVLHLALRLAPDRTVQLMMAEFSRLAPATVMAGMDGADRAFVRGLLRSLRPSGGFLLDIEHNVDHLEEIAAPTLVLFSGNDRSVLPANAERIGRDVPRATLVLVAAASHLIWIGPAAETVRQTRRAFLDQHLVVVAGREPTGVAPSG